MRFEKANADVALARLYPHSWVVSAGSHARRVQNSLGPLIIAECKGLVRVEVQPMPHLSFLC